MQLACPQCGTRDIRVSQRQDFSEMLKGLVGIYPLRCRRCQFRWLTSTWASGAWKFARCPRCYRQELTTWSEQYYRPPLWTVILLRSGATPYRCAACRCNFASFRRCKERFSWRHETKQEPLPPSGPAVQVEKPEPEPERAVLANTPAVVSAPPAGADTPEVAGAATPAVVATTPAQAFTPRMVINGHRPLFIPRVPPKPPSAQPKPTDRIAAPVPPALPKIARSVPDEPEEDLI